MNIALKPKYYYYSMSLLNKCNQLMLPKKIKTNDSSILFGRVKPLLNGVDYLIKGFKLAIYGIALIATLTFEKITKSYRKKYLKTKHNNQTENDITNFQKNHNIDLIRSEIDKFIDEENLFNTSDTTKLQKYKDRALSVYASSYEQYGPVVVEWMHGVLETAMTTSPPKRVVFLARDGIAPYEVAKILKEKYPEKYKDVPLSLLYVSRKVKDWSLTSQENKKMFVDYAKQEGIKHGENTLFIDIGFAGSMIQPIKELLSDLAIDIQFGYLVSHTQNAHGFMANMEMKLESVKAAGQNPAVHWLEDTHQGVKNSATKLYRNEQGEICPFTKDKEGQDTCKLDRPKSYLYKHFGMKAILDCAKECEIKTPYIKNITRTPQQWNMATEKSKEIFNKFLMLYYNGERTSFTTHS